jgi:hypothetical protein
MNAIQYTNYIHSRLTWKKGAAAVEIEMVIEFMLLFCNDNNGQVLWEEWLIIRFRVSSLMEFPLSAF